jgi:hypothetical protein
MTAIEVLNNFNARNGNQSNVHSFREASLVARLQETNDKEQYKSLKAYVT